MVSITSDVSLSAACNEPVTMTANGRKLLDFTLNARKRGSHMSRNTIEVLNGEGEIYAGGRLLRRTTYRLRIVVGDTPGTTKIEGDVAIANEAEALVLTRAEELTLLMDDGRHLLFSLVSPTGTINAHGGLEGIKTSPR